MRDESVRRLPVRSRSVVITADIPPFDLRGYRCHLIDISTVSHSVHQIVSECPRKETR